MTSFNKINPIIGDEALEEAHGIGWKDNAELTEAQKIQCHLKYAHRKLVDETKANHPPERLQILHELDMYIDKGLFPRNEEKPNQRAPCFVDSAGTPCAVAHLLLRSGNTGQPKLTWDGKTPANLVTAIADGNLQYSTVGEIAADGQIGPDFLEWADGCGLSAADLALIQPSYEFVVSQAAEEKTRELLQRLQDFTKLGKTRALLQCLQDVTKLDKCQELAHDIVEFGDKIQERLGYDYVGRVIPKDGEFVGSYGGHMDSKSGIQEMLRRLNLTLAVDTFLKSLDGVKNKDRRETVRKLALALRAEIVCFENENSASPPPLPSPQIYEGLLGDKDMSTWSSREAASEALPISRRASSRIDSLLQKMRQFPYNFSEGKSTMEDLEKLEKDVIVFGDDLAEAFGPIQRRIVTETQNSIKGDNALEVKREHVALCMRPARVKKSIDWFLLSLENEDRAPEPIKAKLASLGRALMRDINSTLEG